MNSTEPSAWRLIEGSAKRAPGPSKISDSASMGSGGIRLPQTTKASMSILPAALVTILEMPQNSAATTVSSSGPRMAPPRCSDAMAPRPSSASAAPPNCSGVGRSPRNIAASARVKNTWTCMTRLASPAGMPSRMAVNSSPNCSTPTLRP
ncbi:hypothetical protein D9M68_832050 [compost metagenome]